MRLRDGHYKVTIPQFVFEETSLLRVVDSIGIEYKNSHLTTPIFIDRAK